MATKPKAWHVDLYARVSYRKKPTKRYRHVNAIASFATHKEAIQFATKTKMINSLLIIRKAYTRAPKFLNTMDLGE